MPLKRSLLFAGRKFPYFDHTIFTVTSRCDAFSIWAQGRLDLNEAKADAIAAVVAVDPSVAEQFVRVRAGADGIAGTLDDRRFLTVPEALGVLQVAPQQMAGLDALLTVDGKTRRVESVGHFGDYHKKVVLISRGAATLWRGEAAIHDQGEIQTAAGGAN